MGERAYNVSQTKGEMPLLSKNIELGAAIKPSSWRKVAIGTWRTAGDPSVYSTLEIDARAVLTYLDQIKIKTGQKVTMTHFVGKAIAKTLEKHPDINCILRFGKLYPRKNIDVFFQVANDIGGKDLSGTTVREANRKSVLEIAEEMQTKVHSIREKGDPGFKKMKNTMKMVPGLFIQHILSVVGFMMYSLNLWSPLLGSPKDPFGSVMVTNIGSLGLDSAFAPLVPYSRVPLILVVGAVKDMPAVRNGKIEVIPTLKICATFDHRLIDGMHASHMVKTLLKIFDEPDAEA